MTCNLQVFPEGNKTEGDRLGNIFSWKNSAYDPFGKILGSWHWLHQEPTQTENTPLQRD